MKILLITDEIWNDSIHGNNVLSNWFDGFDAEFANICCCPGLPENNCCDKYFQITDSMMLKSILKGKRAGRILSETERWKPGKPAYNSTDIGGISFLRKHFGNILRLFKTIVWNFGKYDTELLEKFVKDYNPDIIFSPRYAHSKILRLEKEVMKYTKAPIVAFTGDNEYSLRRFSFSPVLWCNLFYQRHVLKKMMPNYSMYYTLSAEQKAEYEKAFKNLNVKVLMKCGDFTDEYASKSINRPIKIIYAGKIYSKRWETLAKIGECLKTINTDSVKMILDIYTRDTISKKQRKKLHDGRNIFLKGGVVPSELEDIYKNADIALHVESFAFKYRYSTRVSFSTKIIDCLASSCAVMAVAWREHSGLTYLKREDAAICVDDLDDMHRVLSDLCKYPEKIEEYRKKAWNCGRRNHMREAVQKQLYSDFETIITRGEKM